MQPTSHRDAFRAGSDFTVFVFSHGESPDVQIEQFCSSFQVNWNTKTKAHFAREPLALLGEFENRKTVPYAALAWFKIGMHSIYIANMVASGAPSTLVEEVLSALRGYLEDVDLDVTKRDEVEEAVRGLSQDSMEKKTSSLKRMLELLRAAAREQDIAEAQKGEVKVYIEQNYGTVNLGKVIGNINSTINQFHGDVQKEKLGDSVQQISQAVIDDRGLTDDDKESVLQTLEGVAQQGALHPHEQKVGIIKAALHFIPTVLSSTETAIKIWHDVEPTIKMFFHI